MGYPSQPGFVGFKTQTVKGTYKDPGAVAPDQGVFVRLRDGAMGTTRDLLVPDPEIGGNRDVPDAQLGPVSFGGDYNMYLRMESLAFFLKAALGTVAAPTGSVALGYTHVITPGNQLPWVSVEEQIGDGYLNLKYTDCKVNTFHFEADANGYLMATAGLIGLKQEIDSAPTASGAQRWDTSPLLSGPSTVVTWNGVDLKAKSFSFDLTNNMETDDFRLGSLFLGDAVEKRREVTMGLTIRPEDASIWKTAVWGSPAATVAGGISSKQPVVVTITSYEDIPGANAGVKYTFVLTIPKAVIAPFNFQPSGDDVIQHDLELRALRPDPAVNLLSASVKNSFATVP